MPKYTPSEDELDSSYSSTPAPVTPPAEKESVDDENAAAETAVVSNKILSPEGEPLREGDEIVVRVVKNYGDESEIEYAPKGGGETTEEPSTPEQDFAAMDTEKA